MLSDKQSNCQQGAIETFLVCEQSFSNILRKGLQNRKNLVIKGSASKYDEARRLLSGSGRVVAVVKFDQPLSEEACEFVGFLNNSGIYFIAMAKNVSEGFVMLKEGAQEMIVIPDNLSITEFFLSSLYLKIKNSHDKYITYTGRELKIPNPPDYKKVICIGSSTGGAETLFSILVSMPADAPPVLIVQHMPPVFTKLFADRLHANCKMSAWEARDGDVLRSGLILVAPGDYQMTVERKGSFIVRCQPGQKVNGHAPSVDVLFNSVAKVIGRDSVGVILTGMGSDGAKGLLEMRNRGAVTLGQDEESSVVYGMPKVAYDIGGVIKQVSMKNMATEILESIKI